MSDYVHFLNRKSQLGAETGFKPLWMPDFLFDFQAQKTEWAIRKGRAFDVQTEDLLAVEPEDA